MVRNRSRITPSHPSGVANDQHLDQEGMPDRGDASAASIPKSSPTDQISVLGSPESSGLPSWVHDHAPDSSSKALKSEPQELAASQDYLTCAEVAAVLRVSLRTVRRLITQGRIPSFRVGRQIRIPRNIWVSG